MTPGELAARAAREAGCVVRHVATRDGVPDVLVECPDGWAAARLLAAVGRGDVEDDPRAEPIREIARELRVRFPDDETFARSVQSFVRANVRFERETRERFQHPVYTLARGAGDCDCQSRLAVALLRAGGLRARFAFFARKGSTGPRHVAPQVLLPRRGWTWLETTIGAELGEDPRHAAVRLGVTRDDLARVLSEVVTMGDLGFGVEGGRVYRMRLCIHCPREDLPAWPEWVVREAIEGLGFEAQNVWTEPGELPAGWPKSEAMPLTGNGPWVGWAEGTWTRPDCAQVPALHPDAEVPFAILHLWPAEASMGELDDPAEPPAPAPAPDLVLRHTKDLPDAFFVKLKAMMRSLEMQPEWGLAVMMHESGLNPAAQYPRAPARPVAGGLIGFTRQLVPDLESFLHESAVAQLPVAERFWRPLKGKIASAANLHQFNFVPASLARGTGPATIIAARDGTGYSGQEAAFYRDNALMDVDHDGKITVADLERRLDDVRGLPRYREALERLKRAPDPDEIPVAVVIPFLLLASAIWISLSRA